MELHKYTTNRSSTSRDQVICLQFYALHSIKASWRPHTRSCVCVGVCRCVLVCVDVRLVWLFLIACALNGSHVHCTLNWQANRIYECSVRVLLEHAGIARRPRVHAPGRGRLKNDGVHAWLSIQNGNYYIIIYMTQSKEEYLLIERYERMWNLLQRQSKGKETRETEGKKERHDQRPNETEGKKERNDKTAATKTRDREQTFTKAFEDFDKYWTIKSTPQITFVLATLSHWVRLCHHWHVIEITDPTSILSSSGLRSYRGKAQVIANCHIGCRG